MALNDLTRTIPSYKIVKAGWVKFPFNIGNIDMRTAGGLKHLEAAVRSEMTHHHWTVQKNEKEICTAVVQLMHRKEIFGEFEPEMDANIKRQTGFTKTIGSILNERTPFNQNTLAELTKAENGTKAIENKNDIVLDQAKVIPA